MLVAGVASTDSRVGMLLREWRRRRRMSQLELALEAGVSTRHLSFVATGRSQPSPEMVLNLAEQLEVPLRERNQLLLAAGHAPRYADHTLDDPELTSVRDAVGHVLAGHEPYPAFAVDRWWTMVASNAALGPLLEGVSRPLLTPPVNCIRVALHPDGLAPRIRNLPEWKGHLVHRLQREAQLTGDPRLAELLDEALGYPGEPAPQDPSGLSLMVPLRLTAGARGPPLTFFSTVTTFGTAVEVTVSELSVEAFFPADSETADWLRQADLTS
jgi:transcriptional regulator with XRE-family HTH domain